MSKRTESNNFTLVAWMIVAGLLLWFCLSGRPDKPGEKIQTPDNVHTIPKPKESQSK